MQKSSSKASQIWQKQVMDERIQKEKDEEEERKWNDREHKFRLGLRWSSGSSTPASFGDSIGDDDEEISGDLSKQVLT